MATLTTLSMLAALTAPLAPDPASGPVDELVERYRPAVERIVTHALAQGRAYEKLVSLCETAPHRLSGSEGNLAAVAWAVEAMKADGLQDVRTEACSVPHWERGGPGELSIVAPAHAAGPLPMLALGGSEATPADGLWAEVMVVTSFEELFARRDEVDGRMVLFNRPMNGALTDTFAAYGGAVDQRAMGAARAGPFGAVATVVRSMTTRLDDVPHTGGMRYEDGGPRIPSVAVSTLGAERIASLVASGETVELFLRTHGRWLPDAEGFNVLGELKGTTRPEEILVVGGHLDGWDVGQGAHDDGAGCVQAMEAVRLLTELDLRPRRTIRVVLFANEENGLGGARAYREAHLDELDRHVLAVESDRGGFTPRGFTTDANPEAKAILERIGSMLGKYGADRVITGSGGADVNVLRQDGVVVAGYLPDSHRYFDHHHSARDTVDQVNPRELNVGAGVLAAMLYVVADMEQTLPRNSGQASSR